ncbi:MAG TPA: hypothetical protein VN794_22880, partial [Methylomirabilota bacterium]|nr:hypothetical protein [Methylomirabilota bacterium]
MTQVARMRQREKHPRHQLIRRKTRWFDARCSTFDVRCSLSRLFRHSSFVISHSFSGYQLTFTSDTACRGSVNFTLSAPFSACTVS